MSCDFHSALSENDLHPPGKHLNRYARPLLLGYYPSKKFSAKVWLSEYPRNVALNKPTNIQGLVLSYYYGHLLPELDSRQ